MTGIQVQRVSSGCTADLYTTAAQVVKKWLSAVWSILSLVCAGHSSNRHVHSATVRSSCSRQMHIR